MPESALKFKERGIVLLDKPSHLTSMICVEKVKEILHADRAGHSGTLDPAVTGVMLIALNDARKAMPVLIGLRKEYEGTMRLHRDVEKDKIEGTSKEFVGKIIQVPPVRSAVARKPRERNVYSFKITRVQGKDLCFRVECESGTYVRKLCHDFGERLGAGAHMTRLRRTRIDGISVNECVTLEELGSKKAKLVVPLERVLDRIGLKKVVVKGSSLEKIRNGMAVNKNDITKSGGLKENENVGIYHKNEIIALGLVKSAEAPIIKTDRVFK